MARALTVERGDERAFVFRYVADDGVVGVFAPAPSVGGAPAPSVGSRVRLEVEGLVLDGIVAWRNGEASETPGVGVVFEGLDDEALDHLLTVIRAIAYLPGQEEA